MIKNLHRLSKLSGLDVGENDHVISPQIQCVPKKGYPLKSSVNAACSNLNALTP